jgi:VWFA-related protein
VKSINRIIVLLALISSVLTFAVNRGRAQQEPQAPPKPQASPTPTPLQDDQDPVRVFTEEVRLPIVALDAYGHYDPTLVVDDVLVLEDGVAQQIRSVRHVPANVLFLLDTGGDSSGLGGQSKSTGLTRQVAAELVNKLPQGSSVSVLVSGSSADVVQPWTSDKQAVLKTLRTKLVSSKVSRVSDAMIKATEQLKNLPEGSRHVVMITDGVDTVGTKTDRAEAVRRMVAIRATVHVISYTEFVRQKSENKTSTIAGPRPRSSDPISATDPTQPPGMNRSPSFGIGVRFDPAMRRLRKAYEAEVKKSQQVLKNVTDETGGKLLLPLTADQMLKEANEVARAIGAEYVVTYRPKRPLAEAKAGEYRKIEVAARRVGLSLHSRRGYVVPSRSN